MFGQRVRAKVRSRSLRCKACTWQVCVQLHITDNKRPIGFVLVFGDMHALLCSIALAILTRKCLQCGVHIEMSIYKTLQRNV